MTSTVGKHYVIMPEIWVGTHGNASCKINTILL